MTRFEDGQTVHYHMHKYIEDGKGGYEFKEVPSHYTLRSQYDHAVILRSDLKTECTESGCIVDIVMNQESAINFIQQGDVAVALNPEDQAALDYERELYVDCFGE